ncbi:hypothetical protein M0R45_026960 [Rubus argutus]|uniref:DUF7705 domain-containing protein n=1 Tax=Rubus argutus TaxID=59490 RepID=A0AAW1WYY1_RUBAR
MGLLNSACVVLVLFGLPFVLNSGEYVSTVSEEYLSALGDPGMKNPYVRVALEAWNFCNEVGTEAPNMGSPSLADCADRNCPLITGLNGKCVIHHRVNESDNNLRAGDKFPAMDFKPYTNPDLYAVEKGLYLASLCEVHDNSSDPWQFWTIMLKNGNFDKNTTLCPENGKQVSRIVTHRNFPCFGEGCMNQPLVYHNYSRFVSNANQMLSAVGGFYGTYDLDANLSKGIGQNSYFSVSWQKNLSTGSWIFSQRLTTSSKYPWLMLYLRSDATKGPNGGYHYDGRGMMKKLPVSPNFKVRLRLDVKRGGGANSQFYLLDIGGCWKNNGKPCDGNVLTDVTRYSEMIINPATTKLVPLEKPYDIRDPYSNPQAQELVQILPHPEWAVHGYPEKKGDGWVGNPRTWELDVGALSSRLYSYQDPGTEPATRVWSSINVGTEIYISRAGETAEWTASEFDVLVPEGVEVDGSSSYCNHPFCNGRN